MKFGFSIYSLWNAMRRGEMTVEEAKLACKLSMDNLRQIVEICKK